MNKSEKSGRTAASNRFKVYKKLASTATIFFLFVFVIFLISGSSVFRFQNTSNAKSIHVSKSKLHRNSRVKFPLKCSNQSRPNACEVNHTRSIEPQEPSDTVCPDYFRWIHEDLRPWRSTGISRGMLEKGKNSSNFRLAIINGRAYLETFKPSFQTRDLFTVWGIVQLLRLYPGKVPDLELMFECGDVPVYNTSDYQGANTRLLSPPPLLFQYCGNSSAINVVFPDWTFWGWPEVNIGPWERTLEGIVGGSKKVKWKKRKPYAYWRGNPRTNPNRLDLLLNCNLSAQGDWGARLYSLNWTEEIKQGFNSSNLEQQCRHRYKIYVEGKGWSVSNKYIMACDSMALLMKPTYYDFFIRSMVPLQHYWPITTLNMCHSIKYAVQWGNSHPNQAQKIGKRGSGFIKENLKMENVYAYMFHLLREYAKLQKFKPEVPEGAEEVCSESMACSFANVTRTFMEESMVISPADKPPCVMPPPFEPKAFQSFVQSKDQISSQVVQMESEYYWAPFIDKREYLSSLKF